jgi:hypothetical protein
MHADVTSTGLPASVCRQHPRVLGVHYAGRPGGGLSGRLWRGRPGSAPLAAGPKGDGQGGQSSQAVGQAGQACFHYGLLSAGPGGQAHLRPAPRATARAARAARL